jgi:hypothetical protein
MSETAPTDGDTLPGDVAPVVTAPSRDTGAVRVWKIVVLALGVLLVLGFFTVVAQLVYLAARPKPVSAPAPGIFSPSLELPPGAHVRALSLSGDRLAVHYDAPAGGGIAVVDIASGRTVARIPLQTTPAH